MLKSIILSPPCFISPIIADIFYLRRFPIPNKVENYFFNFFNKMFRYGKNRRVKNELEIEEQAS